MQAERSRFGIVAELEHRGDRGDLAYYAVGVSTLLHPNGSLMATGDYALNSVFLAAVYDLYRNRQKGDAANPLQ